MAPVSSTRDGHAKRTAVHGNDIGIASIINGPLGPSGTLHSTVLMASRSMASLCRRHTVSRRCIPIIPAACEIETPNPALTPNAAPHITVANQGVHLHILRGKNRNAGKSESIVTATSCTSISRSSVLWIDGHVTAASCGLTAMSQQHPVD